MKGLPPHVDGFVRYLSDSREKANDDLAVAYFRHRYGSKFVRQADAKQCDGYVPGHFVLELKGREGDWFKGLLQGLAYRRDLDFGSVMIRTVAWATQPSGFARAVVVALDHVGQVRVAIACARAVLHLVPAGEDRPRRAIEAAEAWCDDPSTPFKGAHRPAAQAYVAAYAAYVTAYAASAGHAAAAYVTAYAADATANAAYALGWPAIRPVMLAAAVREAHKDRTAPPREG